MQAQRNSFPRDRSKMQNSSASNCSLTEDEKNSVMQALDLMHVIKQYQDMGNCAACKKISLKNCSRCGTFYCSDECQIFDWPKHRLKCSKQSDTASEKNDFSSYKQMRVASSERNVNEDEKMLLSVSNRDSPFGTLLNQVNKRPGKELNDNKSLANFKIGNPQYRSNDNFTTQLSDGLKDYKKINHSDQSRISPRNPPSGKRSPTSTIRTTKDYSVRGTTTGNGSSAALKPVESASPKNGSSSTWKIPQGFVGKTKVVGTYRESAKRHWVITASNLEQYGEIQSTLAKECEGYDPVFPKVGFLCGCIYSEEWYRGKIVSLSPEVLVNFIDFGNTSKYNTKVFKKLPAHLRSIPALAFPIEFEEGTPSRYETIDLDSVEFTVEKTGRTADGAIQVKVIEGNQEPTRSHEEVNEDRSKVERTNHSRSVLESLRSGTTGTLLFVPGEGTTRFASIVPDNDKEATESLEKILAIDCPEFPPFEAAEGDFVLLTDKEGNDQRGKVISKYGSSYCVQLVDCGNVISTDTVYPVPEDLKNLVELGVKVTVEEVFSEEGLNQETCFFTVEREYILGKWPCILRHQDGQPIAKAFLQNPRERSHPETIHLKSGSTVEVSYIDWPKSFYVRSLDAEVEQKFLDMNMEMIQFAPKAKHCPAPPLPGELCCAKFAEDNCFYRATITSFIEGKVKVLFVDFGNEQETDFEDIKPITESLKKVPYFAVNVTLKNVSREAWNSEIKEYLGRLSAENIELILTYTESIKNGVILKEKVSGLIINEYMEKNRRLKSEPRIKDVFLDDDLTYTTPPSEGTCSLVILYINEREFETSQTFWATIAEMENFNYVNGELSSAICKYCESVSKPYRPTYRELCLAKYEGSWYRAMCAGKEGDIYKVFFVDFGNACELRAESIREMREEFVKAPALAMNCVLHGHEKLKGKPELVSEVYDILQERLNTFIEGVTVAQFENDTFYIKIPEIEDILLC